MSEEVNTTQTNVNPLNSSSNSPKKEETETKNPEKNPKIGNMRTLREKFEKKKNQILNDKNLDETKKNFLIYLLREPQDRTKTQIEFIKKYLLKNTSIISKLNKNFLNIFPDRTKDMFDLDSTINQVCRTLRYKNVYCNTKIFLIGDYEDNMYVIIEGNVEKLKPEKFRIRMNGFEYFKYIMRLKRDNEKHLLHLILENKNKFSINKEDLKILNYIFVKIKISYYFKNKKYKIDDNDIDNENEINIYEKIKTELTIMISNCFCDPEILLKDCKFENSNNISLDKYIIELRNKILTENIQYIPEILIDTYYSMATSEEEKDVTLYKYQVVKIEKNGGIFGEPVSEKKNVRVYTVNTVEDCYLGYLEIKQYYRYLRAEKEQRLKKKLNFLYENYIFSAINELSFSYKYLSMFIYEEKSQGLYLVNQKDKLDYLYFIKEGSVELFSNYTIYSGFELLVNIQKQNLLNLNLENIVTILEEKDKNKNIEIENECYKLINIPLIIKNNNSSIGLDSFYFNFDYLYNARVQSQRISYYKLHINSLKKIFHENKEILNIVKEKSIDKMKLLTTRLISAIEIKLFRIQKKLNITNNNNEIINNKLINKNLINSEKRYNSEKNKREENSHESYKNRVRTIINESNNNKNIFNNLINKNNYKKINSRTINNEDNRNIYSINIKNELNLVNKLQYNIEKNLLFFKSSKKNNNNINNISSHISNNLSNNLSNNSINDSFNNILNNLKNTNKAYQTNIGKNLTNRSPQKLPLICNTEIKASINANSVAFKTFKNNSVKLNKKINLRLRNHSMTGIDENYYLNLTKWLNKKSDNIDNNFKSINELLTEFNRLPAAYFHFMNEANNNNNDLYLNFRKGKIKNIKSFRTKQTRYKSIKENIFRK